MRILVAPNSFKHSLTANEAARAIRQGLESSAFACTVTCMPIGDGGDGTADLLVQHAKGNIVSAFVSDPLGRQIQANYGLIDDGKTAVIEMANASGLRLLAPVELDPLHTTSLGTGQLMLDAMNRGVSTIILCIGGSATVDGGTGIARALGIRFLNKKQEELESMPGLLTDLEKIDFSQLDLRAAACRIIVLCDVKNHLLGEQGAVVVFGPQKGASPADVAILENGLKKLDEVAFRETGKKMSSLVSGGAAGGTAAGMHVLLNAQLIDGIDFFCSSVNFDKALDETDLLITGEGSIDEQTLQGKGPMGVAVRARAKGIFTIGLAGKLPLPTPPLFKNYFDVLMPIVPGPCDLNDALKNAAENLRRTANNIGELLALAKNQRKIS